MIMRKKMFGESLLMKIIAITEKLTQNDICMVIFCLSDFAILIVLFCVLGG